MAYVEQQIYASLDLEGLKAGHHTHAATPGLSAVAIEAHEQICNRWGQFEAASPFTRSIVHLPQFDANPDGGDEHVIVLITDQGRDAKGRPGAMLRHVVRLDAEAFSAFDFNPFHLFREKLLLDKWNENTPFPVIETHRRTTLPSDLQSIFPERYALLRGLLSHLLADGRLHLPANQDSAAAEETLDQMLELLPPPRRAQLAISSFAYSNPGDYQLAVVRRGEASLRGSLQKQLDEPVDGLADEDREYLDKLFAALGAKDWNAAHALVHGGDTLSHSGASAPAASPSPTSPGAAAAQPSGTASRRPPAGYAPPPSDEEFQPSFRRGAEKKSSSKAGIWIGALVVAALAVGGWFAFGPSGSNGSAGQPVAVTAVKSAASIETLVTEHERRLLDSVRNGARDVDLRETMRAMLADLPGVVEATLTNERAAVGEALASSGGTAAGIKGRLEGESERLDAAAGRLGRLEVVLNETDVSAVREAAALQTTPVTLGSSEPTASSATTVAALASTMSEAATAVARIDELAWPAEAEPWGTVAGRVTSSAGDVAPLRLLGETMQGQSEMLASLGASPARYGAALLPMDASRLAASSQVADRARTALDGLPGRVGDLAVFVQLGASIGAVTDAAGARGWLESLQSATDEGAPLSGVANGSSPLRDWLAHWRLAAHRRAGRNSAEGLGGFAAGEAREIQTVAAALDRFDAAPTPPPANLLDQTKRDRRSLRDPVHRGIFDTWIAAQERGRARSGSAFDDVYSALKSARKSFVAGPSADEYQSLQASIAKVRALDLDAVSRDPARVAHVRAVSSLADAAAKPAEVSLASMRVELLSRADYSGTERSLAQVQAALERRGGDEIFRLSSSPVIAPPGAAFQAIELGASPVFPVGSRDRLALVLRDEKNGGIWGHMWFDAPRQGHVLARLAGTHEIQSSAAQRARVLAADDAVEAPDGNGDVLVRVTIELSPNAWSAVASALPELP